MPIPITNENVDKEIKNFSGPVVLEVYAIWCGPCQQVAPLFAELEIELKHRYKFAKLNVDEARDISIEYGVTSVPTFLFFNNGQLKGKETGYMDKDTLRTKIQTILG